MVGWLVVAGAHALVQTVQVHRRTDMRTCIALRECVRARAVLLFNVELLRDLLVSCRMHCGFVIYVLIAFDAAKLHPSNF